MAIRVIAAVLIATGSLAAAPVALAQPDEVITDDQQIRDVLTRQAEASAALDLATAAELTCPQSAKPAPIAGLPVGGLFGTDIESTLRTDPFAQSLIEQISGATTQLRESMAGGANQASTVQLTSVDNIVVTGDTATADVTMTFEAAPNPPQTQITRTSLLRQDGRWCTAV